MMRILKSISFTVRAFDAAGVLVLCQIEAFDFRLLVIACHELWLLNDLHDLMLAWSSRPESGSKGVAKLLTGTSLPHARSQSIGKTKCWYRLS